MPTTPPQPPFDLRALATILAQLRDPVAGCAWDREQTFETIAPYTIEEAYEVADAIGREDHVALRDELGDLLLQVVYHARIAEERGLFDLSSVVDSVCAKMIRRHSHMYGDAASATPTGWEAIKQAERAAGGASSALDGVALALPALMRAEKLQRRAARVGFDWPDASGPRTKIDEELAEVDAATSSPSLAAEIGDLLFSVVNYARHCGVDAETALRGASDRFEARFRLVEARSPRPLSEQSLDELEALWAAAKAAPGPPD